MEDRARRPGVWSRYPDAVACAALVGVVLIAAGFYWVHDVWLSTFDLFSFYMPNFGLVGDRLRAGELPGWNPYTSSGAPLIGDIGSGWMFFPVMILYPLFEVLTATRIMLVVIMLISGLSLYAFLRRLGLDILPALFGGIAFAIGPQVQQFTIDRIFYALANPFYALALMATEFALQSSRLATRLAWATVIGLAFSQLLALWPTQGLLYCAMLIAGWVAYRWLFNPDAYGLPRKALLVRVITIGATTAVTGFGLAAAQFLPLLRVSRLSTIPGGDYSQAVGGEYGEETYSWLPLLNGFVSDWTYLRTTTVSAAVILLAVYALIAGRNRFSTPFFALVIFISFDLAATESVTRWFFYLIPGFEHIHSHRPTAATAVLFTTLMALAACGLQLAIDQRERLAPLVMRAATCLAPIALVFLLIAALEADGYDVTRLPVVIAAIASILLALVTLPGTGRWSLPAPIPGRALPIAMIALILYFPFAVDAARIMQSQANYPGIWDYNDKTGPISDKVERVMARDDQGTAAEFLQNAYATEGPFRYVPYFANKPDFYWSSSARRMDADLITVLANGRSIRLELPQIPGYNSIHTKYYSDFITILNGYPQDYHWFDIFSRALDRNQLLNMLNVQYVVSPVVFSETPQIAGWAPEVYRDDEVIVYENWDNYGPAWMVHILGDNQDGYGLLLLNSGDIDAKQMAFVNTDGELPTVEPLPAGAPADTVTVTTYEPERIVYEVTTAADGFLVMSEVYYDGWVARIDGAETDIIRTNHALRGVAVPAGTHTITVTYEPADARIGLALSSVTGAGVIAIWAWAIIDRRLGRSPAED